MADLIKIGLIIADESEYIMIRRLADEKGAQRADFFTREGHVFNIGEGVELYTVLSGVGTVNAAAAATYLATQGVKALFSFGLSGGISQIRRNEFMVGTEYIEHDFDLTPLGYELCAKPLQNFVHKGDERFINLFLENYPFVKKGVVVSGDSFICDDAKRDFFKNRFNAMSCDMESSAVAYVAEIAKIPFVTLRKISDDAGDNANDSYTDSLDINGEEVLGILLDVILKASALLK